jgi:hypothetical protein
MFNIHLWTGTITSLCEVKSLSQYIVIIKFLNVTAGILPTYVYRWAGDVIIDSVKKKSISIK